MSKQKRNNKESMICLTPKPSQSCFVYCIQSKEKYFFFFYRKNNFLRKREEEDWTKKKQKRKESFLTTLASAIKKGSKLLVRKIANELKVSEKTVKTAIKQDLRPLLNPLHYAIWRVLENKTNATSYLNIGSLKTEEEWNKISEEFILKTCKTSRRRIDTIMEKEDDYID